MPQDNITRAVKKGTGELEGVSYEEVIYEGYGPGGVALIVECLTDNRNRTAGDVRSSLSQGRRATSPPRARSLELRERGVIEVKPGPTEDQVIEAAIERGRRGRREPRRGRLRGPHAPERSPRAWPPRSRSG